MNALLLYAINGIWNIAMKNGKVKLKNLLTKNLLLLAN